MNIEYNELLDLPSELQCRQFISNTTFSLELKCRQVLWAIKRFETKVQAVFERENDFFWGGKQAFYEITFTRKA